MLKKITAVMKTISPSIYNMQSINEILKRFKIYIPLIGREISEEEKASPSAEKVCCTQIEVDF